MTATIILSAAQVTEARAMGQETFERWKGRPGHYRNLLRSHVRGKFGEVAVEEWARREAVSPCEPLFRHPEREREADIRLRFTLADVKTWDASGWAAWGRCIAPTQVAALRRKATVIIWCHVAQRRDVEVTIAGWNTLDEIVAASVRPTGPPHAPVMNHQVSEEDVRDLSDLLVHVGGG